VCLPASQPVTCAGGANDAVAYVGAAVDRDLQAVVGVVVADLSSGLNCGGDKQ